MLKKRSLFIVAAAVCAGVVGTGGGIAKQSAPRTERISDLLRREQIMVLNLDRGPKSAHFYLLDALKASRQAQKDLERAQHQVEQVDATYNKARNRPDDRTLQTTVQRMKVAQQSAVQLEQQLQDAEDELKADIKQTLIK